MTVLSPEDRQRIERLIAEADARSPIDATREGELAMIWMDEDEGSATAYAARAAARHALDADLLRRLLAAVDALQQENKELRDRDRVLSRHLEQRATGRDPVSVKLSEALDELYVLRRSLTKAEAERDALQAELRLTKARLAVFEPTAVEIDAEQHRLRHRDASDWSLPPAPVQEDQ